MTACFNPRMETLSRDALTALQDERLRRVVRRAAPGRTPDTAALSPRPASSLTASAASKIWRPCPS